MGKCGWNTANFRSSENSSWKLYLALMDTQQLGLALSLNELLLDLAIPQNH